MYYVPALVQTADYARAIIKAIAAKTDPDMLQQRVAARLRRKQRLDDADRPLCRPSLVPRPVTFAPVGHSCGRRVWVIGSGRLDVPESRLLPALCSIEPAGWVVPRPDSDT
jgi:hypothetical protein